MGMKAWGLSDSTVDQASSGTVTSVKRRWWNGTAGPKADGNDKTVLCVEGRRDMLPWIHLNRAHDGCRTLRH